MIETPQPDVVMTPPLHRRQSFKRQVTENEKKGALLKAAHMISEAVHSSRGPAYPWQSFRDHHSTKHVLMHYHPRCLDNYEYFIGRNTTTMTLDGYRVRRPVHAHVHVAAVYVRIGGGANIHHKNCRGEEARNYIYNLGWGGT